MPRLVPIKEWNLQLGSRIISVDKSNSFLGCNTQGGRSYGKSSYNIKNSAYVHFHLDGCSEDEAWERALSSVIFSPKELLDLVDYNIRNDVVSPVIILDDAAVHFSNLLFFVNVYQVSLLNATFDTIRTVTRCVMINCPNKKRLMGGLRSYDDYDCIIYKTEGEYERKAVCIKWYTLPDGHRKYRKEFEDYFSCYLPKWVYDTYMVRRKKYLEEVSVELRSLRDKIEKRKLSNRELALADVGPLDEPSVD